MATGSDTDRFLVTAADTALPPPESWGYGWAAPRRDSAEL